jgi:hypothetical protein
MSLQNKWDKKEPQKGGKKIIVISVHKKGNIKIYENYRRINLLNSSYKIYTNIIKNKFYTCYKNKLGEEQNRFQKQ